MKKILVSFLLIATLQLSATPPNLVYISENTTVVNCKDYVMVQTTDEKMIEGMDKTTEIYLQYSIITTDKNGVKTGKFYYLKNRAAYVVTRAISIQSF